MTYLIQKIAETLKYLEKAIPVIICRLFNAVSGLLEFSLFLRLLLKFVGASSRAPVVDLIYKYTDILVFPFVPIFSDIRLLDRMIETSAISAIIGYGILIFIIFKLWDLFKPPYCRSPNPPPRYF